MNVHHRDGHRNARDNCFVSQTHTTAIAQGNVSRCAAHIEGNNGFKTCSHRGPQGANDTTRRAGENRTHWFFGGSGGGDAAAGRLHDAKTKRWPLIFDLWSLNFVFFGGAFAQAREITAYQRLKISIDGNRRSSFVLAIFRKNLM